MAESYCKIYMAIVKKVNFKIFFKMQEENMAARAENVLRIMLIWGGDNRIVVIAKWSIAEGNLVGLDTSVF